MSELKRILVFGGSSLYRRDLYASLAQSMNLSIRVCKEYDSLGIEEYELDREDFVESICEKVRVFKAMHWYKGFFRKLSSYDVVIIGGPTTLNNWLLLVFRPLLSFKVVSWSHGIYGRETGLRLLTKIIFYKSCDFNLVYNNYGRSMLAKVGVSGGKISVVGNCVNRSELNSDEDLISRELESLFRDNDVLLFVGRISEEKRVDMLIEAFQRVSLRNSSLKLVLVGPVLSDSNLFAGANCLENVHLLGPIYENNKLLYFYENSSYCVSPGNIGLTAIASILSGCPVITHNNFSYQGPEFECIEEGKNGFFFDHNNVDSLTKVIDKALNTKFDRESIKDRAREMWSIESETTKIKEALKRL